MSDPKNIPLSEARPGDKVFLKPATVQATRADILTIKLASEWCYDVSADEIDRIERAPRPLEVGDEVRILDDARKTVIVGISDGWAWLKRSDGQHWTRALEGLERVDG